MHLEGFQTCFQEGKKMNPCTFHPGFNKLSANVVSRFVFEVLHGLSNLPTSLAGCVLELDLYRHMKIRIPRSQNL